jgi:serine/threonine protein kinase
MEKQHIITAIENLNAFLKVSELKGVVPYRENGHLFRFAGGFNMVFKLIKGNEQWAFRVWHISINDTKRRFLLLAKYLENRDLPYFSKFIYDEGGLVVNGEYLDTVRMEWLEGKLLKEYLEENLYNKNTLLKLARDFLVMSAALHENKISHGDLQHGNILIQEQGKIRLIDYDSVCIPKLEGEQDSVTGLRGYQHPSRFTIGKSSLKSDYFSELIIYLTIVVLAEHPSFWDKYAIELTDHLLFSEEDLNDITHSKIYQDLQNLSPEINELLAVLVDYLSCANYLDIKPFNEYSNLRGIVRRKIVCVVNKQRESKSIFTSSRKLKQNILKEVERIDTKGLGIDKEKTVQSQLSALDAFYSLYKVNLKSITVDKLPTGIDSVESGETFIRSIKKGEWQKKIMRFSTVLVILLVSFLGIFTIGSDSGKPEPRELSELEILIINNYDENTGSFEELFKVVIDKSHNDTLVSELITQVSEKNQKWKVLRDLTYKSGAKSNSVMTLQEFLKSLQGDRTNSISTIKIMEIEKVTPLTKTINVKIIKKG